MSQEGAMTVDVTTEIVIGRPVGVVAAFAADPSNVPAWYQNITTVTWETSPPLQAGSRLAFSARFLGRHLFYLRDHRFRPGRAAGHAHRAGAVPDGNHLYLAAGR
jgi:hypothetical protein